MLEEKIELALSSDVMEPYTLKDALIFRDHFLSEQPCGNDFRKLILADNKSKSAQDVIKNTSYFCLTTNNVYQELYTLFLSAKQKALIHNYEVTYPRWKAKLYAFLTRIIQIRNLNPTGETISDNLDRAQNALENKNVEIATQKIAQLPSQMQPFFLEFLEKAQNYADASNALENLILSYAKGE